MDDSDCDGVKDLNDDSGNYIKTACLVPLRKNHKDSDEKCRSYGMSFYNVEAPEAKKALLNFSDTRFRPSYGAYIFVNGTKNKRCAAVNNKEGLFRLTFMNCTTKHYFYCQFVRTPQTNELSKQSSRKKLFHYKNNLFSILQVLSTPMFVITKLTFSIQTIIIFNQPASSLKNIPTVILKRIVKPTEWICLTSALINQRMLCLNM